MNNINAIIEFANNAAEEHNVIGNLFKEVTLTEEDGCVICSINGTETLLVTDGMQEENDVDPVYIIDYVDRGEDSVPMPTDFATRVVGNERLVQVYMFMLATTYLNSLIFSINFGLDNE